MTCTVQPSTAAAYGVDDHGVVRRVDRDQVEQQPPPCDVSEHCGSACPSARRERGRERDGGTRRARRPEPRRRRPRPRRNTSAACGPAARAASRSSGAGDRTARISSSRVAAQRLGNRGRWTVEGGLEGSEGELVDPQRTRHRMASQPFHQVSTIRAPALPAGPPSSLSPEAVTSAAPARSALAASGSSGSRAMRLQQSGPDVHDHRSRRAWPARRHPPTP